MKTVPSRSYSITMPYHSMKRLPDEHRKAHNRVRSELDSASITARQALRDAERYDRDWSDDLDPSPKRVHRTSEAYGEERSISVETKDKAGKYQRPSKMVEETVGSHKTTAFFEKGEIVRLEQTLHGHDGGVENMTIQVNKDNTVTYTINETGDFALEPLGYPNQKGNSLSGMPSSGSGSSSRAGSGPDDVYDEWDNSNRGGGPDDVYDEYDNGRGYTYSGPDGTFSYDPY